MKTDYRDAAIRDFNSRGGLQSSYTVTITETLKKTITLDAMCRVEAEQIVSDRWRNSEYILGGDNFVGVEFTTVPEVADYTDEPEEQSLVTVGTEISEKRSFYGGLGYVPDDG